MNSAPAAKHSMRRGDIYDICVIWDGRGHSPAPQRRTDQPQISASVGTFL